ncbi:MAG: Fur family transcriptional regulator, partial [Candidatus Puniceispirillaceae bacterium]
MTTDAGAKSKLTRNQTLVLEALASAGQPLGAYSLLDLLRDQGFKAPLQVYRALDQLISEGLVHRLESLNAWTACCEDQHSYTP